MLRLTEKKAGQSMANRGPKINEGHRRLPLETEKMREKKNHFILATR